MSVVASALSSTSSMTKLAMFIVLKFRYRPPALHFLALCIVQQSVYDHTCPPWSVLTSFVQYSMTSLPRLCIRVCVWEEVCMMGVHACSGILYSKMNIVRFVWKTLAKNKCSGVIFCLLEWLWHNSLHIWLCIISDVKGWWSMIDWWSVCGFVISVLCNS